MKKTYESPELLLKKYTLIETMAVVSTSAEEEFDNSAGDGLGWE